MGCALQPAREAADRASSVVTAVWSSYLATALLVRRWAFRTAGQAARKDQKAGAAENSRCGRSTDSVFAVTVAEAVTGTVPVPVAGSRDRCRIRDRLRGGQPFRRALPLLHRCQALRSPQKPQREPPWPGTVRRTRKGIAWLRR